MKMAAPGSARYFCSSPIEQGGAESVWNASDSFAPDMPDRSDVPVEMIGGLPIAVIDRAQSARLMTGLAAARRNSDEPALVFTSANGQVLSMCAHDAGIRKLYMDA